MKWDIVNFFQCYSRDIYYEKRDLYQWGLDEMKRILQEAVDLAHKAGNTELVAGFANICFEPTPTPEPLPNVRSTAMNGLDYEAGVHGMEWEQDRELTGVALSW